MSYGLHLIFIGENSKTYINRFQSTGWTLWITSQFVIQNRWSILRTEKRVRYSSSSDLEGLSVAILTDGERTLCNWIGSDLKIPARSAYVFTWMWCRSVGWHGLSRTDRQSRLSLANTIDCRVIVRAGGVAEVRMRCIKVDGVGSFWAEPVKGLCQ